VLCHHGPVEPLAQDKPLVPVQRLVPVTLDDPGGAGRVGRGQRVADGLVDEVLPLAPGARPRVQIGHLARGQTLCQLVLQLSLEQVVKTKPHILAIERDDEDILRPQFADEAVAIEGDVSRVFVGADRLAQRRADAVENGALQQPVAPLGRLAPDDFL